jgi:hypothetical protein
MTHAMPMTRPNPQLLDLLAHCSSGVTELALALRDLVLTEAPEAWELLYSVYAEVMLFKLPCASEVLFALSPPIHITSTSASISARKCPTRIVH